MKVTVYLNRAGENAADDWMRAAAIGRRYLDGHQPGDPLDQAITFDVFSTIPDAAVEIAYAVCNSYPEEMFCPSDYADVVAAYRANKHRSLSVGDVVIVGETAFACEGAGWRIVPTDHLNIGVSA